MNEKPLDYGDALFSLCPNATWVIEDNDLENIRWESEDPMPTKSEIKKELERLIDKKNTLIAQKEAAKESAVEKLAKLGLTEEEAKAIIGL
jgi:sugar-specific transcriptional regulator TrmB